MGHLKQFRHLRHLILAWLMILSLSMDGPVSAETINPRALPPAEDMVFMPHIPGLRNKTYRNGYGTEKKLSEAVALRKSEIKDAKASVPAGGLFYVSETSGYAEPLVRDPFLVLGEHTYLVDLSTSKKVHEGLVVKKGEKVLVGDTNYRMWFDYATDHYEKPYAELALISPSGGWPLEMPIATVFPGREEVRDVPEAKTIKQDGPGPQLKGFYLDKVYYFGASRFEAKDVGFEKAEFKTIEFPTIQEATFSMTRPIVMEVAQEDYRQYFTKRIYAYRQPDGFLIKVTDFTGNKVLGEKLVKPVTVQGYKSAMSEKDKYHLTLPEHDIRVELMIHPTFLKHSDFVPWHSGKSHGFENGLISLVVYRNLMTVKHNSPWPLDKRFNVILEPDIMTGMLKRLVLENSQPFSLDNNQSSVEGPIKWSHVWNRPAFKVIASKFTKDKVHELFLRDQFYMRTENMVFWKDEGRGNLDFFVGSSPVLEPILESTFLKRLSDPSFGTVVEESRFKSFPAVVSDASFFEPDHTAPFLPRLPGLVRKIVRNRNNERLLSAESVYIRGSYVDYRNGRIVIPPAGLCYSSRNARNLRTLAGESFVLLGKEAYLATFDASTFFRRDVHLDFWKNQPMGDRNLMYWQDELLGVRNKALRFTKHGYLDDRPAVELSLMKYSGNRWGAHFYMAQGLDKDNPTNRYHIPEIFAEGATYIIPEYIGSNYVKIKEFATPSIEGISFTYDKPESKLLGKGESAPIGKYVLECSKIDTGLKTVEVVLKDSQGKEVVRKTLGPIDDAAKDLLPQFRDTARSLQLIHEDILAEMDAKNPFKDNKAQLHFMTNVKELRRDTPFEFDPRFMVRPDVCGHCYQLNELLLDNPNPIILDKNNPVFEGPKREDGVPHFRIVIDEFDGEMIHAWHIETVDKGKLTRSENLAFRPRNNLDVLVGVTGTVEGFLRLSMLPRLGFIESWRTSHKAPSEKLSGSVNTGGSAHIRR